MSIIYSLHENNDVNALFSSYPMNLILRVSSRKGSASMLSLIPYFDYRRAASRSEKHICKLCALLSLNQHLGYRRAAFRSAKHMSKLCVLLLLNQHLFTIFDIDSLCRFLLQLAAALKKVLSRKNDIVLYGGYQWL